MTRLFVFGGGGHAKVVIETARAMTGFDVCGVFDDDPTRHGHSVLGVPVLGAISLESIREENVRFAIIAIGNNRVRADIAQRFGQQMEWATIAHPTAVVATSAVVGSGSVLCAGAIVQSDTVVGEHVILNTACSVDHDCRVGRFSHVAPGCHVAGEVHIGDGALVGIGSVIAPRITVGQWTTIGAGAVVVRDVPDGVVAKGIPARYAEN